MTDKLENLRADLKRMVNILIGDYLVFARQLKQAHDLTAWKAWGFTSWLDWLATDLNMSGAQANEYFRILQTATECGLTDEEVKRFGLNAMRLLANADADTRAVAVSGLRSGADYNILRALIKERRPKSTASFRKKVGFATAEEYAEFKRLAEFCGRVYGAERLGSAALMALRSVETQIREQAKAAMQNVVNQ